MAVLPPRFRPLRVLAAGVSGEVVLAHDDELDRDVVVKLLADVAASDPELNRRFRREARMAAQLGAHPHVVTVHDSGLFDGRPYIVFELLPGGSLADRLAAGAVEQEDALRWLAQAASALDAAHGQGFVHRDVKPANLLLDEQDNLRLADFGIARDLLETITEPGLVLGTPGYLAPEQVRGEATPATDRYALAALAYELLFGHRPDAALTVPNGRVGAVFGRGLAVEPEQRFETAAAFVEALAAALDDYPQVRTRRLIALPRTTRMRLSASAPAPRRGASAERVVGLAAAFVAVAAVAMLVGMLVAFNEQKPSGGRSAVRQVPGSCTASTADHDANVVVSGIRPDALCRSLTSRLAAQSAAWTYRNGRVLLAPDHGSDALSVVCRLHRGELTVTVYDSGSQEIGRDICNRRFAPSWNESSLT